MAITSSPNNEAAKGRVCVMSMQAYAAYVYACWCNVEHTEPALLPSQHTRQSKLDRGGQEALDWEEVPRFSMIVLEHQIDAGQAHAPRAATNSVRTKKDTHSEDLCMLKKKTHVVDRGVCEQRGRHL